LSVVGWEKTKDYKNDLTFYQYFESKQKHDWHPAFWRWQKFI